MIWPSLMEGVSGWPLWAASLGGAVLGALIGGGSLWLMGWTGRSCAHRSDGLGDVKMMFMVGLSRLASDDPDHLHGCVLGIEVGIVVMLVQAARPEDLFALWHLPGNRRNRGRLLRTANRRMVRRTFQVWRFADCQLAIARSLKAAVFSDCVAR